MKGGSVRWSNIFMGERERDHRDRVEKIELNVKLSPLVVRIEDTDRASLAALAAAIQKFFKEIKVSAATDALLTKVTAARTVIDSAVAYVTGVPDVIREAVRVALEAAGVAAAEVDAAVDAAGVEIEDQTADLLTALTTNTPTPPVPQP